MLVLPRSPGPRARRQKPKVSFGLGEARARSQRTYADSNVSELRFGFVLPKCARGELVEFIPWLRGGRRQPRGAQVSS
ncbi:hypothetical protein SBA4_40007 [Candidatus Sulfopaludibacter sp. SbA4]|nr:hypothetical protein SBA4_40007 [Candidatus Sulfopaludibacter sp. SbA4]